MKTNRRLEILLSPKDYELLRQKALDEDRSVGELVREAIREKYGGASIQTSASANQRFRHSGLKGLPSRSWGCWRNARVLHVLPKNSTQRPHSRCHSQASRSRLHYFRGSAF